jgi:hypothetical protein
MTNETERILSRPVRIAAGVFLISHIAGVAGYLIGTNQSATSIRPVKINGAAGYEVTDRFNAQKYYVCKKDFSVERINPDEQMSSRSVKTFEVQAETLTPKYYIEKNLNGGNR